MRTTKTPSPDPGLFVTNHLNLMFCLASGFIGPPYGFGDKYYEDVLSIQPGSIPLFINKIPKSALDRSVKEARYLIPTIVEINLQGLELSTPNSSRTVAQQLQLFETPPPKKKSSKSVSFTRVPISITRIRRILVESDEHRNEILDQVQLRNNVPLKPDILKRRKTSFNADVVKTWKDWQPKEAQEEEKTSVHLAQASGGILATLNQVENRSAAAKKAFTSAFEVEHPECPIPGLSEWMAKGQVLSWSQSIEGYLLWSLVEHIARHRNQSSDNDLDDIVLYFMESIPDDLQWQTIPLCKTLRELRGLGGLTIPEYFNSHKSPLERAIILFFLRRQCEELFDFDDGMMSDMDWAYSAILFGARSGWLRLPVESRGDDHLRNKICDWMASYSQRIELVKAHHRTEH